MEARSDPRLQSELVERRARLREALSSTGAPPELRRLLGQVDAALARWDAGTFGLCEVCHDAVEDDRLQADPLIRFCIDHLDEDERSFLERDLALAARVQQGLLPKKGFVGAGWEVAYRFEPSGMVSGDYCEVLAPRADDERLLLAVGDVSGKGVAASLLSTHLTALFRTLRDLGLSVREMAERANRLFCESIGESHYATLVLGAASADGEVELCNAAQPPPILIAGGRVASIAFAGLPLGMFCTSVFEPRTLRLAAGDALVLYTDGITEARNADGVEFGSGALAEALRNLGSKTSAEETADACLAAVDRHRGAVARSDDRTVLVLRRNA